METVDFSNLRIMHNIFVKLYTITNGIILIYAWVFIINVSS